jgi:hypothetical protein
VAQANTNSSENNTCRRTNGISEVTEFNVAEIAKKIDLDYGLSSSFRRLRAGEAWLLSAVKI